MKDGKEATQNRSPDFLGKVTAALPDAPLIRAWDITRATGISAQVIGNLREQGAFTAFNLGAATRPRYRYSRESFLKWLAARALPGEF